MGAPIASGAGWGGGDANLLFKKKFPENWMEMKKIGLGGEWSVKNFACYVDPPLTIYCISFVENYSPYVKELD